MTQSSGELIIPLLKRLAIVAEALRQPRSLVEIAEIAGASPRTIHRDIHFLRQIGAPVVLTIKPYVWRLKGRWSFWRAMERLTAAE